MSGALVVANGWQNVLETNRSKGLGTQLVITPTEPVSLNWSTWVSDEGPAARGALRVFNNVYAMVTLERIELVAGVDVGVQQLGGGWSPWWGRRGDRASVAQRDRRGERSRRAVRGSQRDHRGAGRRGGRHERGSAGLDLYLHDDAALRTEGRLLVADREAFSSGPLGDQTNVAITTSLAARFGGPR